VKEALEARERAFVLGRKGLSPGVAMDTGFVLPFKVHQGPRSETMWSPFSRGWHGGRGRGLHSTGELGKLNQSERCTAKSACHLNKKNGTPCSSKVKKLCGESPASRGLGTAGSSHVDRRGISSFFLLYSCANHLFVASFTSTSTTLLDHHIHHASQERYVHLRIPSILTGRMQSIATSELRC
jgi:hypothetical protein